MAGKLVTEIPYPKDKSKRYSKGQKEEISGRSKPGAVFFLPVVKFHNDSIQKVCYTYSGGTCADYTTVKAKEGFTTMEKALKIKLIISTIVICIVLTILALALVKKYTPSETMRSLDNYYDVAPEEAVVLFENDIYGERALLREGGIYLALATVDSILNDEFYLDEAEQLICYTLPEAVIRAEEGQAFYYSNGEKMPLSHPAFLNIDGVYYLSLEFTEMFSNMSYHFYENPNRVVINYQWSEYLFYDTIEEETPIRVEPDIKSDILRVVPAGVKLYYIGGMGTGGRSFIKVMTEDGIYGYVQKKFLGESYYDALQSTYVEPEYSHITMEEKVMLGWQIVTVPKANENLEQLAEMAKEMNVISPTWYRLADTDGNLTSLADADYVKRAHELGLQVWALIDNFDAGVSTYDLLSSTTARATLISRMMEEAKNIGFDGWNIDFETLTAATGPHYIQFIKELSVSCRREGLVLSVDNYVPAPYNEFYDLEAQGKVVDYVVIMAYDEHYSGSATAGSVASINFLKDAVNNTLAKMPRERIVMAIPFYTRLWAEEEINGETKLSSEALTMNGAQDVLKKNKVEAEWDATTGQNYAEYKSGDTIYKIWMEDVDSLHERMKVIAGADVAGMAAWRLGYETEEIWPIIDAYMN